MRPVLFYFLFILTGFACRKEITADNTDKHFPLTLSVSQSGENTSFSWEEAKITGFERYVLIRSISPIPTGGIPFSGSNFTIYESTDPKITSAVSSDIFFDSTGYFKLYLSINGRWLESDQVVVDNKATVVPGAYVSSFFLPDSSWLVLFTINQQTGEGKMSLIDYAKHKSYESNALLLSLFSTDQIGVDITHTNGKPEVWFWNTTGYLQSALPDLATIKQATISNPAQFSFAAGGGGIVMTTQNSVGSSFNVRRKSNLSILKSYTRQNYFEHRTLLVLDTSINLVAEISASKISAFRIDPITGATLAAGQNTINTLGFPPFLTDVPVSPDHQYFCPHFDDIIYDRNLNVVLSDFIPTTESVIDLCFAADGQSMYVLTAGFNTSIFNFIHKISFPGGIIEKSIKLNNNASRIMRTSDGVMVVVSANSSTAVKKIAF